MLAGPYLSYEIGTIMKTNVGTKMLKLMMSEVNTHLKFPMVELLSFGVL